MGVLLANLKPLIDKKQITSKIRRIARAIDREYAGKDLTILMVLKGSICLVADLIRCLSVPCEIEVVQAQSYGEKGAKRGELQIFGLDRLDLKNRDILIVDDIFDSGKTLLTLKEAIQKKEPRSIRTLVLLSKKVSRDSTYRPDYVLFDIENQFVVGFGLDYKEHYRNLSGIFILEEVGQ